MKEGITVNKKVFVYMTLLITIPFLTLFLTEAIHRGSIRSAYDWIFDSSFSFLISYLFYLFLVSSFIFLPKKLFIPFLFLQSWFWFLAAYGSFRKFQLRGTRLMPADLELVKEGMAIMDSVGELFNWKIGLTIALVLVLFIVMIYLGIKYSRQLNFKTRAAISLFSILIFAALTLNPQVFSMRVSDEQQKDDYGSLGLAGGYLEIREKTTVKKPFRYGEDRMAKVGSAKSPDSAVNLNFKPNVIVVLAEALWDPLKLEKLNLKYDPIPNFRELYENYPSGEMRVHIYGGGTFNSEVEVLTGLTTRFQPEAMEAYYINRPTDSLAHVLRKQGYHTAAVHNFKNWFYNRSVVYKHLGFEKFVAMEFFNYPVKIGPYIDDNELMNKALTELKKTKGPDFLNIVTVASHGPYIDPRYNNLESCSESSLLNNETKYILDLYCRTLKDTDESIKTLIDGVKELDEPTIIAIYGDHLPMLGNDFDIYRRAGYMKDTNTYSDYEKMYSTPMVIWDNFTPPGNKEHLKMTPNFLGSYLLDRAKKEMSPVFRETKKIYDQGITIIPRREHNDEEKIDSSKLEDYKLIHYDTLYGNQYLYQNNPISPVKDYFLGSERIEITSAETISKGKYNIRVTGNHFVEHGKVFCNDRLLQTKFVSENVMLAVLPESMRNQKEKLIDVKVIDDQKTPIAKTKLIPLDGN
ncbi:LTA synthase family protein [Bacillus massilinigeriensis]|uniref:LTA synthase family protein n=1 Tax=Bacillus mediterraneensis TaxID=1805474 RepID=UPI0008F8B683|nr:LTA synthase family protein [Bacillus mediterraneensis]